MKHGIHPTISMAGIPLRSFKIFQFFVESVGQSRPTGRALFPVGLDFGDQSVCDSDSAPEKSTVLQTGLNLTR
jgi:hypothetical protein